MTDAETTTPVRISRRRLIGTAAAASALVAAGGASAVLVTRELGGGASPGTDAGLPPPDAFHDPAVRLRHLLRRATFTAAPADVARFQGRPLASVVDALIEEADRGDDATVAAALDTYGYDFTKPRDAIAWWMARMLQTATPLRERVVLFWHGLLTSGLSKVGPERAALMVAQNAFFRANALGPYDVLLKGIVRDPAMMLWLDIHTSKKGSPNENCARELMELFTLGPGNYTERDIRESARAHTGYSLAPRRGYFFDPARHDGGSKTFLGQTGNFDADAIVDIVLAQDAAPAFFAERVFEEFTYRRPDPSVIEPIARVARDSGFDMRAVLRAVLTSEAFYAPEAYRAIVRSPVEFVIGSLRLAGLTMDGRVLVAACRSMGQTLFDPPNVAGWPGGRTWLGTSAWFARVNAAGALMNGFGAGRERFDGAPPETFVDPAARTSAEAVDAAALTLVDGVLDEASRATLRAFLDEGGPFASLGESARQERLRGLVTLLLASPEYQLA